MEKDKYENLKALLNGKPSKVVVYLFVASVILSALILLKGIQKDSGSFTWNIAALFCGLLWESILLFKNLQKTMIAFCSATILSLIIFVPATEETIYNLHNHIIMWPYIFLALYIVAVYILKGKDLKNIQTEGTTLLQTLALLYWLTQFDLLSDSSMLAKILLFFICSATLLSLINAFTNINLGNRNRLLLSVWSSIVLMCLAIDNFVATYTSSNIGDQPTLLLNIEVGIQYFFIGVSSVYMLQNFILLMAFVPDKKTDYNITFKEAKEMHLGRYSNLQISKIDSLLCVIYSFGLFYLNYSHHLVPESTAVWIVIATFPVLINLRSKKNNY